MNEEFDWHELLDINEENILEDDVIERLYNSYKTGYLWLVEQLIFSKNEIKYIEIRLCHNGSNEYQPLA